LEELTAEPAGRRRLERTNVKRGHGGSEFGGSTAADYVDGDLRVEAPNTRDASTKLLEDSPVIVNGVVNRAIGVGMLNAAR